MTINIAVAVAEGLVMAADSWVQMANSAGKVSTTHSSAEKLTEIGDRPIGVMIHGSGSIEKRSILSLIREFEFLEYAKEPRDIDSWSVWEMSARLAAFIEARYGVALPAPPAGTSDDRPSLGLVVGGFSPGEFFPEVVTIEFPGPIIVRELPDRDLSVKPFGGWYVEFWGVRKALKRLIHGYDIASLEDIHGFLQWAEGQRATGREDLGAVPPPPPVRPSEALGPYGFFEQLEHRLDGMPLQEAVEFADFLGTVAIGYDKFSKGDRSVGGDLDVLAIQPEGLSWYRRKPFARQMAEARDGRMRRP